MNDSENCECFPQVWLFGGLIRVMLQSLEEVSYEKPPQNKLVMHNPWKMNEGERKCHVGIE